MPGKEHKEITETAINSLPAWQKKILGAEGKRLLLENCTLPDLFFDLENGGYEKALPYMLFIDGIQFHYLPNSPIQSEYKFWKVVTGKKGAPVRMERALSEKNLNWEHASKGFHYYISNAVESLRKDNVAAFSGFAGVLLHILQDAGVSLHSLEGVDGVDVFALDRLIQPPAETPLFYPSLVLTGITNKNSISCSAPLLMGESVAETAFLLYFRYFDMVSDARKKLIPIICNTYRGNTKEVQKLYSVTLYACAKLCASVIYTIVCIASGRFVRGEVKKLQKIYISDIKPVREPRVLSSPYGFLTMMKDAALDKNKNKVPLELLADENNTRKKKIFKKGLGTGCHYEYRLSYELPAGVYRKFHCYTGLHRLLGKGGNISVAIKFRNKNMFSRIFNDEHPSSKAEFDVSKGGLLELVVRADKGWGRKNNNIVWGEPVLLK